MADNHITLVMQGSENSSSRSSENSRSRTKKIRLACAIIVVAIIVAAIVFIALGIKNKNKGVISPSNCDCNGATFDECRRSEALKKKCPYTCHNRLCVDLKNCDGITPANCRPEEDIHSKCAKSCGFCQEYTVAPCHILSTKGFTCKASSEYSLDYSCSKAYDSNISSGWATKQEEAGAWIFLEFPEDVHLSKIETRNRQELRVLSGCNFRDITLSFSDGSNQPETLKGGGFPEWNVITISQLAKTKYVNISATRVYGVDSINECNAGAATPGFSEMRFYDCPDSIRENSQRTKRETSGAEDDDNQLPTWAIILICAAILLGILGIYECLKLLNCFCLKLLG